MAPPKKPFEAAYAKAYTGAQGIKRFFAVIQPKKKAGRPPKKRKKNGVIAAIMSANATRDSPPLVNAQTFPPAMNTMVNALTSPLMMNVMVNALTSPLTENVMVNALTSPPMVNAALTTLKKTHLNWGKGEHRDLLAKTIQDWLNKEGDAISKNGEEILKAHLFANKLGIPPQTFYKYICTENRSILGDESRGKKKWMTNDDILFAGCVLAHTDQENDGLLSKEAVNMIQELKPNITREGAHRQIIRYVLPVNAQASVLKKSAQKV